MSLSTLWALCETVSQNKTKLKVKEKERQEKEQLADGPGPYFILYFCRALSVYNLG